ncbi:hypothetical protein ACO0QE_003593 [Hanseniaspora vineae]
MANTTASTNAHHESLDSQSDQLQDHQILKNQTVSNIPAVPEQLSLPMDKKQSQSQENLSQPLPTQQTSNLQDNQSFNMSNPLLINESYPHTNFTSQEQNSNVMTAQPAAPVPAPASATSLHQTTLHNPAMQHLAQETFGKQPMIHTPTTEKLIKFASQVAVDAEGNNVFGNPVVLDSRSNTPLQTLNGVDNIGNIGNIGFANTVESMTNEDVQMNTTSSFKNTSLNNASMNNGNPLTNPRPLSSDGNGMGSNMSHSPSTAHSSFSMSNYNHRAHPLQKVSSSILHSAEGDALNATNNVSMDAPLMGVLDGKNTKNSYKESRLNNVMTNSHLSNNEAHATADNSLKINHHETGESNTANIINEANQVNRNKNHQSTSKSQASLNSLSQNPSRDHPAHSSLLNVPSTQANGQRDSEQHPLLITNYSETQNIPALTSTHGTTLSPHGANTATHENLTNGLNSVSFGVATNTDNLTHDGRGAANGSTADPAQIGHTNSCSHASSVAHSQKTSSNASLTRRHSYVPNGTYLPNNSQVKRNSLNSQLNVQMTTNPGSNLVSPTMSHSTHLHDAFTNDGSFAQNDVIDASVSHMAQPTRPTIDSNLSIDTKMLNAAANALSPNSANSANITQNQSPTSNSQSHSNPSPSSSTTTTMQILQRVSDVSKRLTYLEKKIGDLYTIQTQMMKDSQMFNQSAINRQLSFSTDGGASMSSQTNLMTQPINTLVPMNSHAPNNGINNGGANHATDPSLLNSHNNSNIINNHSASGLHMNPLGRQPFKLNANVLNRKRKAKQEKKKKHQLMQQQKLLEEQGLKEPQLVSNMLASASLPNMQVHNQTASPSDQQSHASNEIKLAQRKTVSPTTVSFSNALQDNSITNGNNGIPSTSMPPSFGAILGQQFLTPSYDIPLSTTNMISSSRSPALTAFQAGIPTSHTSNTVDKNAATENNLNANMTLKNHNSHSLAHVSGTVHNPSGTNHEVQDSQTDQRNNVGASQPANEEQSNVSVNTSSNLADGEEDALHLKTKRRRKKSTGVVSNNLGGKKRKINLDEFEKKNKESISKEIDYTMVKSPESVQIIWEEYIHGCNGNPSIMYLENTYGSKWRRHQNGKTFSRRKRIYKFIVNGMKEGKTAEDMIDLLEKKRIYADKDGKQKLRTIGWLQESLAGI